MENTNLAFTKSPFLWAIINLLITLGGILFLHWSLQPIIYLFWLEIIFNVISSLIRVLGAMDGKPFLETLKQKILLLIFGVIMGGAMIMLTVAFTIDVFKDFDFESFAGIQVTVLTLAGNYLLLLLLNFFLSGRFRKANPVAELVSTFVYLLILLVLIMAITQHFIPSLNLKNSSMWVGLAVILIKFVVDFLASYFRALTTLREEIKSK